MSTTLKLFEQNKQDNFWIKNIFDPAREEIFADAIQLIKNLVAFEPAIKKENISLEQFKNASTTKKINQEEKEFAKKRGNNILVWETRKWHKRRLSQIDEEKAEWEQNPNLKGEDKKRFLRVMEVINEGKDFHRYATPALLQITHEILPFLECYLSSIKHSRRLWGWLLEKKQRQAIDEWLTQIAEEMKRLQQAIASVLLFRLEAGFAQGDASYDDGIAYAIAQLHNLKVIQPKEDPTTKKPVPLLLAYQHHDMTGKTYGDVLAFLQRQSDPKIQNSLKALPIFQEKYVKKNGQVPISVFRTVNHTYDGVKQAVPENFVHYVPTNTWFFPRWLFQGRHLRATFFQNYAVVIAQLKIPLPNIDLLPVRGSDITALIRHTTLARLQQERLNLEKTFHEIQKQHDSLAWYQGTTKVMLREFQALLKDRLIQTVKYEAQCIAKISDALRGDADILTNEAVNVLAQQLESAHQAYQRWQKNNITEIELAREKETFKDAPSIKEALIKGLSYCQLSKPTLTKIEDFAAVVTPADCLQAEEICIVTASEAATEILLLLERHSTICDVINADNIALLRDITEKQSISPARVLSKLQQIPLLLLTIPDTQPLQKLFNKLLQAKMREAEILRKEQFAFQALHDALTEISHFIELPEELVDLGKKVSDMPENFSHKEKFLLLNHIQSSIMTLRSHYEQHENHYINCQLDSIDRNAANVEFHHTLLTMRTTLLLPAYSVLFSRVEKLIPVEWNQWIQDPKTQSNEQLYAIVTAIAQSLSNAIKNHNDERIPLQRAFSKLEEQRESLGNTIKTLSLESAPEYLHCCDVQSRLQRESLGAFSLSQPKATQESPPNLPPLLFPSFVRENVLGNSTRKKLTAESLISGMENLVQQACIDLNRLVSKLLKIDNLFNTKVINATTFKTNMENLAAVADEIIRLGQLIQNWGTEAEKKQLDLALDRLLWNYCERWSAETLPITDGEQRRRHHQLSISQEVVLQTLAPKMYQKIFDERKFVMDYKSWFPFVDVCRKHKKDIITRRKKLLMQSASMMSTQCLVSLRKNTGCKYVERFEEIRDEMAAKGIMELSDPNLTLYPSERQVLSVTAPNSQLAAWLPFTLWRKTKISSRASANNEEASKLGLSSLLIQGSAQLKQLLQQQTKQPPQNLDDIEKSEAIYREIIAILPTVAIEQEAFHDHTVTVTSPQSLITTELDCTSAKLQAF